MERKRTIQPPKHPLRIQAESLVISTNKILREKVGQMNYRELLQNMAPDNAAYMASQLKENGLIGEGMAFNFIRRETKMNEFFKKYNR